MPASVANTPAASAVNYESLELSPVEFKAVEASPFAALYPPAEKIPVITVDNFPALGRLAAMRFIEWVQQNPGGVISLPTGKTPEHFIKWVERILARWDSDEVRSYLTEAGIDPAIKPDMGSLYFVQIDEFYPIDSSQQNSFYHYVNKYYLDAFQLDPAKALLIDCNEIGLEPGQDLEDVWPDLTVDLTLRTRQATTELERLQQDTLARIDDWCQRFEDKIRSLGGIGFFLGGIGPDGHIGFNVRGSDHHSTTRLMTTNYETQAAAAGDLGGIEISSKRLVITIGLGTICFNPKCAAVIVAAGEAKAGVVRDAVTGNTSVLIPAASLRRLPNARFYITMGAGKLLSRRRESVFLRSETMTDEQVDLALVDLCLAQRKRFTLLTDEEANADPVMQRVLEVRRESLAELAEGARARMIEKIEKGSARHVDTRFLHTEPHHDDIMLGYLPLVVRNVRDASNVHYFVTLTSGFTAVSNAYMLNRVEGLNDWIDSEHFARLHEEEYFDPANAEGKDRDIWQYLDGIAANDEDMRAEGAARRFLRNLIEIFEETDLRSIADRLAELEHYLSTVYPGKKDTSHVQRLKGMCREWEAETLWGYFGWQSSNVFHSRLGFYTGDLFTEEPTMDRDVPPVLRLLEETNPDIISVAFDPEASGPDTHYKVLQAINEGISRHAEATGRDDIKIWGYRNVWYRFHPSEANVFCPVSLNMFSVMESSFLNTFVSQKEASFPSYEHDGPFCELAQRIQVEQYHMLKTCLGREWFAEHPSPLIRCARGFVFLKEMDLEEFTASARRLRKAAENQ
jgi:glucosamine-6-phosphate deaminase